MASDGHISCDRTLSSRFRAPKIGSKKQPQSTDTKSPPSAWALGQTIQNSGRVLGNGEVHLTHSLPPYKSLVVYRISTRACHSSGRARAGFDSPPGRSFALFSRPVPSGLDICPAPQRSPVGANLHASLSQDLTDLLVLGITTPVIQRHITDRKISGPMRSH
ncbi:hypothetical protein BC834DRAFT_508839 [Gloeopeniophorella convolvens]|nr:hypothetical protein BC834DRAFT_508839 [Gloeopeniophorella convolvens]